MSDPRRRLAVILPLLLAAANALAATAANPEPPRLRLPEIARPLLMTVDLRIVPEQESFDGRVEIDFELEKASTHLWLNGRGLEIRAATLQVGDRRTAARMLPGGDEFVGFDFGREVPVGRAQLSISYRGRLDPLESEGLFRQKDGDRWYVFSQFESTYARRAFPCFDEPAYRTPWKLTLHVAADQVAVSNAPAVAERPEPDGMKAVEFAPTQPIPSYLVALGVGPFALVDAGRWGRLNTPVRLVVANGKAGETAYAAEVTGPLLVALEEYFESPFPFGKLDSLAVPHTVGFGAMENPGLITYADRLLVADPARETLERQRSYAVTAAHEISHSWFGDAVTMRWWDDIWLNEGFATWMEGKIVARFRPEWGGEDENASRRRRAINADSLASSRPVRRPIRDLGDIETAFDGISYAKGGALLSMFESWMGPERFRKGVQRYIAAHTWGNATSDDFLAALAAEGAPEVAASFATFLDQPGAPVVSASVACRSGRARLELAQRRFVPLGSPVSKAERWRVPVTVRYGTSEGNGIAKIEVAAQKQSVDLDFCPEWVQLNHGGFGYYISDYPPALLERLAAIATELPVAEQIALVDDSALLFAAGDLAPAAALGLLPRFAANRNRLVFDSLLSLALSIDDALVAEAARPGYRRFVAALFAARARELGLERREGEGLDDTLLRPKLVEAMGLVAEDPAVQAEARRRADAWLADPKAIGQEMLGTVLSIAARSGDVALFDRLEAAALREEDRRTRGQILGAIGRFRDPAAVERALALVLSGKFDIREANRLLFNLAGDRVTRPAVLSWIERSYDSLVAALPEPSAAGLVGAASGVCDAKRRNELAAFFRPRQKKLSGGGNYLEQVLDRIDICVSRRERQEGAITAFLQGY